MSANTVELQPAWVLHVRPYRDTSLLVDCLTHDYGKVSMVASGARGAASKAGKPRRGHLLQPFSRLLIGWFGKRELKSLRQLEQERFFSLTGKYLYSGLYANELLMRLLQPGEVVANLFDLYAWLIDGLYRQSSLEIKLRVFEKCLLEVMGYGIPLSHDSDQGDDICDDQSYLYQPSIGFIPCSTVACSDQVPCFSGALLNAFSRHEISESMLPNLKRLTRMALTPLIGNNPLRSRELFQRNGRINQQVRSVEGAVSDSD
ncbi:MAG: DNA repair protein RecO [Endozoicomonadaceae bacterium]|nr:DNA repair protein RecO [Endozoicomonadaceae bacterium]